MSSLFSLCVKQGNTFLIEYMFHIHNTRVVVAIIPRHSAEYTLITIPADRNSLLPQMVKYLILLAYDNIMLWMADISICDN